MLTKAIRLLGLFIWGIDLDNKNHDALNAVLQPAGIGKFSAQNGLGSSTGLSTYIGAIGESCVIEGTQSDIPSCCDTYIVQIAVSQVFARMDIYRFVNTSLFTV